jgi:hypothetical protein
MTAEQERAAIVKWLREQYPLPHHGDPVSMEAHYLADAIERGDHHPTPNTQDR